MRENVGKGDGREKGESVTRGIRSLLHYIHPKLIIVYCRTETKAGDYLIGIRHVETGDKPFWFSLDRHLSESEFAKKVRGNQGYVLLEDGAPFGLLRYNLFWDNTPCRTMLYVEHGAAGGILPVPWKLIFICLYVWPSMPIRLCSAAQER